MELQWPLIIFTFFVALSCGVLGSVSILALRGKGEKLQMPSIIVAALSLVAGGIGAFFHLEHWERIFNGFGHLSSGITLELIGCVVLALIIAVWLLTARTKAAHKALAWVSLIAAVGMMVATADSYLMAARPAWGWALIAFYVGNACLLGPIAVWALAMVKGGETEQKTSITMTFVGAVVQLLGIAIYAISLLASKISEFGYYADPTKMTTHPTHIDSLANIMFAGSGAPLFWLSCACVVLAIVVAVIAKKKPETSVGYMTIAAVAAIVASLLFRALMYVLASPVVLLY